MRYTAEMMYKTSDHTFVLGGVMLSRVLGSSKNRTAEIVGISGAVLWAGILRVVYPGVSPFAYDEAELSRLALELARSGHIPTTGMISSAGVPNLPASVWIFALPYALFTNPEASVIFVALLNTLSVIGVWWFARRVAGGWAGVASAWLLAGSPYGIFYSRGIWAQDLLIPLSVLWAISGLLFLESSRHERELAHKGENGTLMAGESANGRMGELGARATPPARWSDLLDRFGVPDGGVVTLGRRRYCPRLPKALRSLCELISRATAVSAFYLRSSERWLFLHGVASALAPQVHYAGFVLPVLSILVGSLYRFRRKWLFFLLGALVPSLTLIPLVIQVLSGSFRLKPESSRHFHFGIEGIRSAATIYSGYGWDWIFIGGKWHLGESLPSRVSGYFLLAVAGAGLFLLILRLRKKEYRPSSALLLLWAAGSPVIWTVHFLSPKLHYQLVSLPGLFVVSGCLIALLPRRSFRIALLGLVVFTSLIQGSLFAEGIYIAGRKVTQGGISTPLKYHLRAVNEARDGTPIIGVVPDTNLRTGGDAAILDVLLWEYPHRLVNGTYSLVWPSVSTNLLFVGPWMPAWVENKSDLSESGTVKFIRRREGSTYPYVLVKLEGGTRPEGFNHAPRKELSNGLLLEGWRAHPLGTWLRFVTLWKVEEVVKRVDYHQFNHLYTIGSDKPVAGHDVPTSSYVWREGDYLITWADFPAPPKGKMKMAIGMYEYPSMRRVPWKGVADPVSPVFLGPFELK